ncbi:MAG: hypothetical protein GDA53_02820 [Rhodobacteraceae bacterium]|nr:hypothetical protein [Paracoccaceae bacterium]
MANQTGAEISRVQNARSDHMKDYLPEGGIGAAGQFDRGGSIGAGIRARTCALLTIAGVTAKGAR